MIRQCHLQYTVFSILNFPFDFSLIFDFCYLAIISLQVFSWILTHEFWSVNAIVPDSIIP